MICSPPNLCGDCAVASFRPDAPVPAVSPASQPRVEAAGSRVPESTDPRRRSSAMSDGASGTLSTKGAA